MIEVAKIIDSIRTASGKKEKEDLIRTHKGNELFKDVLNHLFNPYIKTNIAKKKLSKKIDNAERILINSVNDYMVYLGKSTGKDENVSSVQCFIDSQPEEVRWLLEEMATKTIKIGATASTINKAFGYNFIPTFELMLSDKWVEVKRSKGVEKVFEHWRDMVGKNVIATPKLDGNRVVAFVRDEGVVELRSRSGHILDGYVDLEKDLGKLQAGFVYDGEILATNEEGLNSQELFTKTSSIARSKGIKQGIEFHIFDMLPIEEFEAGGSSGTAFNRKYALSIVVNDQDSPWIKYVDPIYTGQFDKDIIDDLAQRAKNNGEEGIMVQLDTPYECKRTRKILKVKSMESADIRCVDIYEGKSGKNIGRLGGLILDFKGNKVSVGGGFSDDQRVAFFNNPDLVLNKIIEINYFEEFESDDGSLDLRFATFKSVREDKDEPSYH